MGKADSVKFVMCGLVSTLKIFYILKHFGVKVFISGQCSLHEILQVMLWTLGSVNEKWKGVEERERLVECIYQ